MNAFILNIGLANMPVEAGGSIGRRALFATRAIRQVGLTSLGGRVVNSDTEPTLVVDVMFHIGSFAGKVKELCELLNQDCIGVYQAYKGDGALIGPRAEKWGPFNPEFFFMMDGSRLKEAA